MVAVASTDLIDAGMEERCPRLPIKFSAAGSARIATRVVGSNTKGLQASPGETIFPTLAAVQGFSHLQCGGLSKQEPLGHLKTQIYANIPFRA